MRTLGLIGGLSWESTAIYYRRLNELTRERLGGSHSASLLLHSFDFAEIETLQRVGDWDAAHARMVDAALRLERGGAEALVICANTMHVSAEAIGAATSLPLLHIVDSAGAGLSSAGIRRPAFLATAYSMEKDFLRRRFAERFGIECVIPDAEERKDVHDVIYRELCRGIVREESKARYLEIIDRMRCDEGVDGVLFACTEIGMLLRIDEPSVPAFDATELHIVSALDFVGGIRPPRPPLRGAGDLSPAKKGGSGESPDVDI